MTYGIDEENGFTILVIESINQHGVKSVFNFLTVDVAENEAHFEGRYATDDIFIPL